MKTLIKNVRALLPDGTTPLTNIMIDRDKIAAIGEVPDGFRAAKVIDGTGKFAVPGFINAHTHASMTLFRSYADDMNLMDWLNNMIWPAEAKMQEEDIYWGAMLAAVEMIEGGTKNRIREVGGRQIFEHGYDGTSVRGIMLEVGGEVGLFYYYYKTKDELFTDVLDHFFEPYRKDFEALAAEAKEKPYRALLRFFSYIKREVRAFRAKYEGNMHRTVRWAIREQTLTVIEPYIEDIIRTLMTCGAKPTMDPHTMAIFLAHGLGSCILHEDADWVDEATDDMRRTVNLIMGLSEEESRKMFEDADGKANAPAAVEGEKENEM